MSKLKRNSGILSSTESDPFDDSLDDLLKMGYNGTTKPLKNDEELQSILENIDFNQSFSSSDLSLSQKSGENSQGSKAGEMLQRHSFGDFGTYFSNKQKKQKYADEKYVSWDKTRRKVMEGDNSICKQIFKGNSFFVNGYTETSINELHRLIVLHGGTFLSYLGKKSAASYFICDRLTPKKEVEFQYCRVVKSKWVLDSISNQQILDWKSYRLIDNRALGQFVLDSHMTSDSPDLEIGISNNYSKSNCVSDKKIEQENSPFIASDFDSDGMEADGVEMDDLEMDDLENFISTQSDSKENFQEQPEVSAIDAGNHNSKQSIKPMDARNPKFLEGYFEKSRLHKLSTWKADIRQKCLTRIMSIPTSKHTENAEIKTNKTIMHIDFDSFFASASCLKYPKLDIDNMPIAVTHGGNTSDIASCNYVARRHGLRNGMWGGRAKELCPSLVTIGYEFELYERLSEQFYNYLIQLGIFDHIFPVSVDEVLVDSSSYCDNGIDYLKNVSELAEKIRNEIYVLTKCRVSVGVGRNALLARLASRKAKPNGYYHLHENVQNFLDDTKVKELPGVGYYVISKISKEINFPPDGILMIKHLKQIPEKRLIELLGEVSGRKLYAQSRGKDNTSIRLDSANCDSILGRKSVSVDVNYGIRFNSIHEVDFFLMQLSNELNKRLENLALCGTRLTLRLAKRALNHPIEPPKYLGMGICDFVSKSSNLGVPTNVGGIIGSEIKALLRMINIPVKELRGIAITMSKLRSVEIMKNDNQKCLPFKPARNEDKEKIDSSDMMEQKKRNPTDTKKFYIFKSNIQKSVLNELPADIRKEIELEYGFDSSRISPVLTSPNKSPTKPKSYMQQLISKEEGKSQYVRVVHSPTKQKKKTPSPSKPVYMKGSTNISEFLGSASPSPKKKSNYMSSLNISSYDSSVLKELPSSMRQTVLSDLEYMKKVRNTNSRALRKKMEETKADSGDKVIRQEFQIQQKKMSSYPTFLNEKLTFSELKKLLEEWIYFSLDQAGPHDKDLEALISYFKACLESKKDARCLNIISHLKVCLDYHEAILNCKTNISDPDSTAELHQEAVKNWRSNLEEHIIPLIGNVIDVNSSVA